MMPVVTVRKEISDLDVMLSDKSYEEHIKSDLLMHLGVALKNKVEYTNYKDPINFQEIISASVVAMSPAEFQSNYGNRNRGIAEGTMAIMHNGMWKVINSGTTSPLIRPTPKVPSMVEIGRAHV